MGSYYQYFIYNYYLDIFNIYIYYILRRKVIIIGLDNGIIVRNAKNKYKGIKDFWDGIDAGNDIVVAYWRKCWGIRDQILTVLNEDLEGGRDYKLGLDELEYVIKLLKEFTKREYWDEYADSIWTFDEFKNNQKQIIKNLKRLYREMNKYPNIVVYFYDSY